MKSPERGEVMRWPMRNGQRPGLSERDPPEDAPAPSLEQPRAASAVGLPTSDDGMLARLAAAPWEYGSTRRCAGWRPISATGPASGAVCVRPRTRCG